MRMLRTTLAALLLPLAAQAQERQVLTGPAITIWNLAGDVRLERGTGNDVVVEVTRGGTDSRSSTTLQVREDGTFGGDWNSGGRRTEVRTYGSGLEAYADLVVKVPAGKRVEVNLAVGSIAADGVEADLRLDVHAASVRATGTKGRLVIDAGSGSVRVENASGELEVDTGSGSTTISGLRVTRVAVDAGSGSIDARDVVAGRFSVDAGSGTVSAEGLATDDLYVDTGSGSVRVALTKVPGRTEIETGSGGISSDFAVTMEGYRRRELRGRIGDGGPVIRVSTGSGGVRLLKR